MKPPLPVTRPGRKSTIVRQAEIVDAAMRVIAHHGSRRFTARLVAAEIGVSEGAIFRHFESMDAILDGVVDRLESILFEAFPPPATDPIERLGLFFRHRVRIILANPHVSSMLLSDHLAQAGGPERAAQAQEFRRRSRDFVVGCLREARTAGELADGVDPEAAAILVLGAILALAHSDLEIGQGAAVERLAVETWACLERVLRGGGPAGSRPAGREGGHWVP